MLELNIPKILQCNHFIASASSKDSRIVRDYEFDFYLDGERDMYIDGKFYKISKGCLVFKKPGQQVTSSGDYNMYMLTLDFSLKSDSLPNTYLRSSLSAQQEIYDNKFLNVIPDVFYPFHKDEIESIYKKLCAVSFPNTINESEQNTLLCRLIFLILSDVFKNNKNKIKKVSYVEEICNYINLNYSKDISVSQIANDFSLNKNHLIRLFKKEIMITPNQYIMNTRLFYSRLMLIQTELSIKDIGFSCGFNTTSYFIKCFKDKYGVSPLTYKTEYFAENQKPNII
jgi:AraC-like DNA-binding protein